MSLINALKSGRVLSIDPSSHSYAFSVMEVGKLLACGKISFGKNPTVTDRFNIINSTLPLILKKHKPTVVVIEKTIFIQNPQTTITLAYIVGALWSKSVESGIKKVVDVVPPTWKASINYKNVSAKEKKEWETKMTKTEVTKKAAFERKERVKRIIDVKIPGHNQMDNDIIDALGIGLYAVKNLL